jgi:haloalkane dehalogenase
MHVVDEGSGDPVVLVHGNPTWSFLYRRLIADLRGSLRVIAPDHIGCGLSAMPPDADYPYTLARRIDDLDALLETLGANARVSLVVHDWGGAIGCGVAIRHPERFRRIVLLNTAAFGPPEGKRFPVALRLARSPLGPLLVQGLGLFCRGWARLACRRTRMSPAVRAGTLAPYDTWAHRRAVLRFVEDIPRTERDPSWETLLELERRLDRLREVPMQLFWGERDPIFDRSFRLAWQRRFPGIEAHVFPGGGHNILEDAYDLVLPRLRRFLAEGPDALRPGALEVHA